MFEMFIILGFFLIYLFVQNTYSYDQLVKSGVTIATSSSTLAGYPPSRAVDENNNQHIRSCSHTSNQCNIKEAWLLIDLTRVFSIKYVKFWYRTDRRDGKNMIRLPGYSILFSNASWPNMSCYKDPKSQNLSSIIENECRATTQYIWFYQPYKSPDDCAPMLEICEVQVYGCRVGFYGEGCLKTCGVCKSRTCDIVTGQCDRFGCIHAGFQAPMCIECNTGFYGFNCTAQCSKYCKNNTCDRTTGTCLGGCVKGFTGFNCNTTCPPLKYGENCSELCGNCFENLPCNHIDGTCMKGCQEGFRGQRCRTTCMTGTFGKDCMQNCSGNCFDNLPCNKTNGICTQCLPGWMNDFCTERIVSLKQPEKDGSTSLAVIVGPATGLVVVIVTLVVFIAILRFTYVFKSYSRLWVIISDTALMLT